jgi:hypothetical protein
MAETKKKINGTARRPQQKAPNPFFDDIPIIHRSPSGFWDAVYELLDDAVDEFHIANLRAIAAHMKDAGELSEAEIQFKVKLAAAIAKCDIVAEIVGINKGELWEFMVLRSRVRNAEIRSSSADDKVTLYSTA